MYAPPRTLICPLAFLVGELRYEISDDLSFNGGMRAVLDIKLTQLYSPECQSPGNFRVAYHSP